MSRMKDRRVWDGDDDSEFGMKWAVERSRYVGVVRIVENWNVRGVASEGYCIGKAASVS